jgi:hypothetical protein
LQIVTEVSEVSGSSLGLREHGKVVAEEEK